VKGKGARLYTFPKGKIDSDRVEKPEVLSAKLIRFLPCGVVYELDVPITPQQTCQRVSTGPTLRGK